MTGPGELSKADKQVLKLKDKLPSHVGAYRIDTVEASRGGRMVTVTYHKRPSKKEIRQIMREIESNDEQSN
jgi:hypothetical protein